MTAPIAIGDQKFTRVKGVWTDHKKTPAPKDLVPLLDKIEAEYLKKSDVPPLPIVPSVSTTKPDSAKIELVLSKLVNSVEKLTKSVDRLNTVEAKKEQVAQKVSAVDKVPSLVGAMGLNTKEFFAGRKDEYGRVTQPGLLRNLATTVMPLSGLLFAAQDRRREAIAQQKIMKENSGESPGEAEQKQTEVEAPSKYSAKVFTDQQVQAVKVTEIDESVLDKLKEIFGSKDSPNKEDGFESSGGGLGGLFGGLLEFFRKNLGALIAGLGGGIGSLFSSIRKAFSSGLESVKKVFGRDGPPSIEGGELDKAAKVESTIEKRVDKLGREYHVDTNTGRRVSRAAAEAAEQAPKKAGILSKVFSGEAKNIAQKVGMKGLGKTGLSILGKAKGGIGSLVGGIALDYAAEKATESGYEKLGAGLGVGSSALSGAGLGATIGSVIPGIGTVAGGLVGGGLGAAYGLFKNRKELFGNAPDATSSVAKAIGKENVAIKSNAVIIQPDAEMSRSSGIAPQTQILSTSTRKVMQEKEKKMMSGAAPVVTNISSPTTNVMNNNQTLGMPTIGPRGSLDMETYRTRGI